MLNHEMRNPLGTLAASLKLLQKVIPTSSITDPVFARCSRAMLRCERIASSLLDYSKPFPVNPELHYFDHWIEGLLNDYRVPATIAVVWKLGTPVEIWLDDEMMRRSMVNLLDNSVRAILSQPTGSKRVLTLETQTTFNEIELILTDTGPGMPSVLHGDSAPAMTDSGSQGTGYGLLIARQVVERHQGVLTLGNSPQGGAEVRIRFPILKENNQAVDVLAAQI